MALEGFQKAISTGNLPVMFLLIWAGLCYKVDIDLVIWAFRNGGGDKIATVSQLLRMDGSVSGYSAMDRGKFLLAARAMIEEAREEGDQAMLDFLEEIKHTDAFSDAFNWCRSNGILMYEV